MRQRNCQNNHLESTNSGGRCRIVFLTESFLTVEVYLLAAWEKREKRPDSRTMYRLTVLDLKSLETHEEICCKQRKKQTIATPWQVESRSLRSCRRTRRPWMLKQTNKKTPPQKPPKNLKEGWELYSVSEFPFPFIILLRILLGINGYWTLQLT